MKRKHKEGFTSEEVKLLLKEKGGDWNKFYSMLNGVTCISKDGELIYYADDVYLALKASLGVKIHPLEWD